MRGGEGRRAGGRAGRMQMICLRGEERQPETHSAHCEQTCLLDDLGQHPGRDRRHLAGLADAGVAKSHTGGHLEGQEVQGQVPGTDQACHTYGGPGRVVDGIGLVQDGGTIKIECKNNLEKSKKTWNADFSTVAICFLI